VYQALEHTNFGVALDRHGQMGGKKKFWHLTVVGSSLYNLCLVFVLVFLLAGRWELDTKICLQNFVFPSLLLGGSNRQILY
jgi:hypothetical protein